MKDIDYTYLFAGVAVLITVLALWANLWVSFARSEDADDPNEQHRRKASSSLGIFWIYSATFIVIMSVAFILMGKYWVDLPPGRQDWLHQLGFGFLIAAAIMAIINMFESALSVFLKGWRGRTASTSHLGLDPSRLRIYLFIELVVIALLLTFSTVVVLKNHIWWWGYLPTLLLGALVFAHVAKSVHIEVSGNTEIQDDPITEKVGTSMEITLESVVSEQNPKTADAEQIKDVQGRLDQIQVSVRRIEDNLKEQAKQGQSLWVYGMSFGLAALGIGILITAGSDVGYRIVGGVVSILGVSMMVRGHHNVLKKT